MQLNEQATEDARARHRAGVHVLNLIFGYTRDAAAANRADRRRTQSAGPTHPARFTQKHWARAQRRKAAKAQRVARRRNRP